MFERSSITQAVNSVYRSLQNRLVNEYNIKDIDDSFNIADEILKIHGLDRERFSIISLVEQLLEGSLNDISIDDNSNKNSKTMKGILKESTNSIDKILGYRYLYRKMVTLYSKKEASYLSGLMYDYSLAMADSTNLLLPYCWALDSSKIVTIGKPFKHLKSKPTKRIDSYISVLNEVVHQLSNHLAGAIAIGTFFLDLAHLLLLKERVTMNTLNNDLYRIYLKNQYQRIVHGFNSLSRTGGQESPFTNISLFDRPKLRQLIKNDYSWYFYNDKMEKIYSDDEIVEFIIELQNIFMEFFDEGDPTSDGMPYRFPIATLNISKKKDRHGNWVIEDKEFLKSACKKDIYRYNIFCSEGTKVASCCRLISDLEMMDLASQSNSFGAGGSISLGSHRVVTVNFVRVAMLATSMEDFYKRIKDKVIESKKILYAHKELLKDLVDIQIFLKEGWVQLDRMFSTLGILGVVEAEDILKIKFKDIEKEDIMYNLLKYFNNEVINNN